MKFSSKIIYLLYAKAVRMEWHVKNSSFSYKVDQFQSPIENSSNAHVDIYIFFLRMSMEPEKDGIQQQSRNH